MHNIEQLKRGDLVVFNMGKDGYPMVFHSFGYRGNYIISVRGYGLRYKQTQKILAGETELKDAWKDRVQGDFKRRVWKITEDCLTEEELKNYNDWKKLLGL